MHKKSVSYCVKTASGEIVQEGELAARREELRAWAAAQAQPWRGAMEATLFSAWIYDTLKPYAQQLDMAHPARMKAITAGKKKSDRLDARTIADLLRCNLLPTCYVLSPEMRDLRRLLRYRQLVVGQSVRMQNKMAGLLMETGAPFVKVEITRQEIFHPIARELAGGAGVGEGSAADESRRPGDVRDHAETTGQAAARRTRPASARRAAGDDSRAWAPSPR